MAEENNQAQTPTPEQGYDTRDARAGLVAFWSGLTMVLLLVFVVGTYWLYQVYFEEVEQEVYGGVTSKELIAIREREDAHLYKYALIDKTKGVVRIPIDRAIEILAGEYAQGKVFYNTATYAAKSEPAGGAAAPVQAPASPSSAVQPVNNAQTAPAY
jgi:hypothetical protein